MEQSLKFLYHRIKKTNITKEQAESKVCQEILISKMETLLFDKKYYAFLEKSERNWMAIEPSVARNEILSQLRRIVEAK